MFLDTTTKTLELLLGSAVTTTAMPVTVDYVDLTTTTTIAGSTDTQSNGVTPVTILAAPAASTQRKVNGITVYNADSVAKLVTVRLNNNATLRILVSVTLQVGDTLVYTDVNGWYSLDSSGSIKEVASGTLFGNITVAGTETDTAVGTQKVISQDASKFREAQQSTLTSGTAYTTNGSLLIMKAFLHNTGIDTSGNLTAADATDYCTGIFYSEDDKLKGFSSAAAVTAGNTPTLSLKWYIDTILGVAFFYGNYIRIGPNGNGRIYSDSNWGYLFAADSTAPAVAEYAFFKSDALTKLFQYDDTNGLIVTQPTGLGYGSGSGGTVTQQTSRTTGVTLNKPSGQITMFTAVGSTTPASFTVTNSVVGANDVPTICVKSGATNTYIFMISVPAAGSFVVTFWTTGGTASDTPVLQFNIGKGATA